MVYLNKMIPINMTYAYDTMHETIFVRLNFEREKTNVLLQWQQNKNYIITTCNNTFHLSVGEMTITLNDVALLLDIPIIDPFYNCEHIDKEAAILVLLELLGVEYKDAFDETKKTRGE